MAEKQLANQIYKRADWHRRSGYGNPGPLPSACRLLPTACCLLLIAFGMNASAATRWNRQSSGTLAWLHAVFFLDQNRGWAVGSKGAFLATVDGGKTWQINKKPTDDVLRDVYFSDAHNGWLVCETNVYELKSKDQPRTYLMTTHDGGATWTRLNMRDVDIDTRLVRVVFSPQGRGWVFGEAGTLYTTVDKGQNWKRQPLPTRHLLLGGALVDNDRGWLVGAASTILQTSDGGETWHASNLAAAQGVRFNATSFIDNRLGWAVGAGGKIFRTVNGGREWQPQASGVTVDLLDVKFVNALDGWAAADNGTIVHTFDGGLHWTAEPSNTHPLERIYFTDRDHGWAVGFGGAIVAYTR